MIMLLALPQPGPRLASAPRADTACSSSIDPRPRPSRPEPPTRSTSRRVTPNCGSHRSFPDCPGTMIIVSLLVSHEAGCTPSARSLAYQTNIVSCQSGFVLLKIPQILRIRLPEEPGG